MNEQKGIGRGINIYKHTYKQIDISTEANRQKDRQVYMQTDKQTARQTDAYFQLKCKISKLVITCTISLNVR